MAYYPHKGDDFEERSREYKPSPVLLVKRVRTLKGQPYYHKEMCERQVDVRHYWNVTESCQIYQHHKRPKKPSGPRLMTPIY